MLIHNHRYRFASLWIIVPPQDILQPLYQTDKHLFMNISTVLTIMSCSTQLKEYFPVKYLRQLEAYLRDIDSCIRGSSRDEAHT